MGGLSCSRGKIHLSKVSFRGLESCASIGRVCGPERYDISPLRHGRSLSPSCRLETRCHKFDRVFQEILGTNRSGGLRLMGNTPNEKAAEIIPTP
jgi:hypothetical protein